MSNIEMLSHEKHAAFRYQKDGSNAPECRTEYAVVLPAELMQIQKEYPIFFKKDAGGRGFYTCALMGFHPQENLFFANGLWESRYIPLTMRRGPFLIGQQQHESDGEVRSSPVVFFDTEDARIRKAQGEFLFDENGEPANNLREILDLLLQIDQGLTESREMIELFLKLQLLEPLALNVELKSGERLTMNDLYTINNSKFCDLQADKLYELHKKGFLSCAYCILNSLSNVSYLIDKKCEKTCDGAKPVQL